ncbi:long-chain acyl-CoA synthetase [Fodinibius roseus]|uniref:Long-chain acyl-CoA synthetase n=1 Tax=Fodinibius roseus TaxID=1194090 RepID=A0A1M5CSN5_9BACT|nr:class I adenylate-forming enzyme family protein [Fodinibius roseus]SHF57755.1 long-chain acyl-CoA synthetase [Fodinibius roseus]
MQFEELLEKQNHARRLASPVSSGPFGDIKELLEARADERRDYLISITDNNENSRVSYAGFCRHVLGCGRFLQNHGLRRGDRIATIAHNHWHTAVQYFAAWLLGLTVIPINLEEKDKDIAYILAESKIELAFVRTEYRTRFRKILELYDNLKHIEWIVCEGETDNFTSQKGSLTIDDSSLADSEAMIVFKTGDNEDPLGVVLTQANLLEGARSVAECQKIRDTTRLMCVLPIYHVNIVVTTLLTSFFVGGSTVLRGVFRPDCFFRDIAEEQVNIVSLEAPQLQSLNSYYEEGIQIETPSLHYVTGEGTPLHAKEAERFEKRFGIPVVSAYSLPETSSYACCMPVNLPAEERRKWRSAYGFPSIGRPVSADEMAIHSPDGEVLGEKERGEVVIRGNNVMLTYYGDRKANEKAFKHGWLRSGDKGFYVNDEKGRPYFFVVGRMDD